MRDDPHWTSRKLSNVDKIAKLNRFPSVVTQDIDTDDFLQDLWDAISTILPSLTKLHRINKR